MNEGERMSSETETTFKIKYPTVIPTILSLCLSTGILIYLSRLYTINLASVAFYLYYGWLLLSLIALVVSIYIECRKPGEIQFAADSLTVNGKVVENSQITEIIVMGYFKPAIGIKIREHTIVPHHLCFSFIGGSDPGQRALTAWSKRNEIKMSNKRFFKWF
ncbi:hypothetical protein EBB07_11865 [Paenibacillaceae bacterium]|nr:hypothetical protein EBB07_11865 [Paenibacillaceae bacterium]